MLNIKCQQLKSYLHLTLNDDCCVCFHFSVLCNSKHYNRNYRFQHHKYISKLYHNSSNTLVHNKDQGITENTVYADDNVTNGQLPSQNINLNVRNIHLNPTASVTHIQYYSGNMCCSKPAYTKKFSHSIVFNLCEMFHSSPAYSGKVSNNSTISSNTVLFSICVKCFTAAQHTVGRSVTILPPVQPQYCFQSVWNVSQQPSIQWEGQ